MWIKVRLKPESGLFLLKSGSYQYPNNIIRYNIEDEVIGYCIDDYRIISTKIFSTERTDNAFSWSIEYRIINGLFNYDPVISESCGDLGGIYNTECIRDYCISNNIDLQKYYPATYYCTSYSPGYRDGEWYLPSVGELRKIIIKWNDIINCCRLAGIMKVDESDIYGQLCWSSNISNINNSISVALLNNRGGILSYDKSNKFYVIPFLKNYITN